MLRSPEIILALTNLRFQLVYASFFVAQLALTLVKISIVLFYKRVFVNKGFRTTANVVIAIVIGWFISFFFVGRAENTHFK